MHTIHTFTGGFTQTNGYLLKSPGGASLLFDAPEGAADWLDAREETPAALILTHAHFDHVIDAAAVKARFGCPIHAFAQPDSSLTLENALRGMGMPLTVDSYEVDHLLEGESRLEAGGVTMDVLHVPGHSPDSLCFHPDEPDSDGKPILIAGDVLFQRGIGRTDFPHSDHEALIRGIRERLYPMDGTTVVHPGHGPSTTIGEERRENPFVTAGPPA